MNCNISYCEVDANISHQRDALNLFSSIVQSYFKDKSYGTDVYTISIGIIMVRMEPGYEAWYKPRKPRYIKYKEIIPRKEWSNIREKIIIEKELCLETRLSNDVYDQLCNASEEDSWRIFANELLKALRLLDELPKKIKDFNKEQFKDDAKRFLVDNNLL